MPLPRQARRRRSNGSRSRVVGFAARNTAASSVPVRQSGAQNQSQTRTARRRRSRRRANRAVNRLPVSGGAMISSCSWDYAACLLNPVDGPIGCMPDLYGLPSTGYRIVKKGAFAVGTTGYGYVVVDPDVFIANNTNSIVWTSSAFAGSSWAVTGTGTGVDLASTSPMAAGDFGSGSGASQFRVVAFEIRVCYTGALSATNGRIVATETIDHSDLNGVSFQNTMSTPGVNTEPIQYGKWYSVRWSGPKVSSDRAWTESASTAITASGHTPIGIAVLGTVGDNYCYEIYGVYEVTGQRNYAPRTDPQDPMGVSHVASAFNSLGPNAMQHTSDQTFWSRLVSGISAMSKSNLLNSAAAAAPALGSFVSSLAPAAASAINGYAAVRARQAIMGR